MLLCYCMACVGILSFEIVHCDELCEWVCFCLCVFLPLEALVGIVLILSIIQRWAALLRCWERKRDHDKYLNIWFKCNKSVQTLREKIDMFPVAYNGNLSLQREENKLTSDQIIGLRYAFVDIEGYEDNSPGTYKSWYTNKDAYSCQCHNLTWIQVSVSQKESLHPNNHPASE